MLRQGEVPQDFHDVTIIHNYERKCNRQLYDNDRGNSLLNIAGEIFARILLSRPNNNLQQGLLRGSHCGSRRCRGTTDMIFAARKLQEKCQEMRIHLYSTFVDLAKVLNTVDREGLWKTIQKSGCLKRLTHMVRQLHDGMMAQVTDNKAVSEAFALTDGAKRGCVLAPTLFSLMFSAMLMDAHRNKRPGSASSTEQTVKCSTTGGCTSNRMSPQPPLTTAPSEQLLMETCKETCVFFSATYENFGLIMNTEKMAAMHQPPPNTAHDASQISVNGIYLQIEDNLPLSGQHPLMQHQNRR
ncbi:hypothetical protein SprV_0200629100 [Sparganum proliferum]